MKFFYLMLFALAFVNYNCSNDNQAAATPAESTTVANPQATEDPIAKLKAEKEKKTEELKKLNPYTPDVLKKLLPKEVNGMKQKNLEAHSALGFAQASCSYKKDSIVVELNAYDCAGEIGASQYGLNYWAKLSVPEETENGYTKAVDFNGGKAVATWDKSSNQVGLRFMAENRLLVMLSAKKLTADQLKTYAEKMNFK